MTDRNAARLAPPPATRHCRTCAAAVHPMAVACAACGTPPAGGAGHCWRCAAPAGPGAIVCLRCGVGIGGSGGHPDPTLRSALTAGLLGVFLGWLGAHRFYLGYPWVGVAQILVTVATLGVGGLWGVVEGVLVLAGSTRTDALGRRLRA